MLPISSLDTPAQFRLIANHLANIYEQKNTAYGNSFSRSVEKYGLIAALTRISDKFNRLENLIVNPFTPRNDERLSDTLLDLASYCIMTVMELKEQEENENVAD